MSSTTPTMRSGWPSASRSSATVSRASTTSAVGGQAAHLAAVTSHIAGEHGGQQLGVLVRSSGCVIWPTVRLAAARRRCSRAAGHRPGWPRGCARPGRSRRRRRRRVEDAAQPLLAVAQRLFGALALGHLVPQRCACARRTACSMRRARPVTISSSAPSSAAAISPTTENSQALACRGSASARARQYTRSSHSRPAKCSSGHRMQVSRAALSQPAGPGQAPRGAPGSLSTRHQRSAARPARQQRAQRVVHAQGHEDHAALPTLGRRRRLPRQRLVDDHADLVGRLLRQAEAGAGAGLAAACARPDGRARGGDGQRIHAQRRGVALQRLDVADGHHLVVAGGGAGARRGGRRRGSRPGRRPAPRPRSARGRRARRARSSPWPADAAAAAATRRVARRMPSRDSGGCACEHAMQRLQRLQRAVQPGAPRVGRAVGLALEGAAQTLFVPARHGQRRRHQQRGHQQQRHGHRARGAAPSRCAAGRSASARPARRSARPACRRSTRSTR